MTDKVDTRPITAAVQAYANGDLTRDQLASALTRAKIRRNSPMTSVGDDHYEVTGTWREVQFAWADLGLPDEDLGYVIRNTSSAD